jgi:germination protein M
MLKKSSIERIILATIILLLLLLFSIFPKDDEYNLSINNKITIEYTNPNPDETFLLDSNNYIGRANILLSGKTTEGKIRELVDILIIDGKKESSIPNGFRAIIPSDTRILGIDFTGEGIVKLNFSKELFNVKPEQEEKIIEAIIYSLTSLTDVKGVLIYIEGELLTTLPQTKKRLPALLKRDYGINKIYNIESTSNINSVTVYYITRYNDNYYYVPVTKYSNDNRDKIKIIIDELSSGPIYETNLMSFLNANTKLLNYELSEDTLSLNFNSYILDDLKNRKILEEVIYSISLSIGDNYDVLEVIFMVHDEEVEKSVIKTFN